ncbi:MAG: hypothetical protein FWF41_05725 [Betaproteobacteria bacterium]|nr:hypothetical protein [Betaproteobacteria bacterium]
MKCPDCGSDSCQRLEVAYQGGTSSIQTKSTGVGVGWGRGGLGLGAGKSRTSGTSQTQLAAKAAPPRKRRYAPWGILLFAGFLIATSTSRDHWGWVMMGVGFMVVAVGMILLAFQFNRKEWPGMYRHWLDSWICHTCGKIFSPQSGTD